MKRKYKLFFEGKSCDLCGENASIFRVIENKKYMLCNARRCSFQVLVKHGWHEPLIRKRYGRII